MKARTAEEIMERGGFSNSDTGPFVTALREQTRKQVRNGLTDRSPGTWGPEGAKLDAEGRAKALLAVQWAIERGHTYRVECLESPFRRVFDARTMKRRMVVHWDQIRPWLSDRWRELGMRYRIWKDRNVVNPYE